MSLQIYIPGIRGASLEPLRQLGLSDLLDAQTTCMTIDVHRDGPDGGAGVCFHWESPVADAPGSPAPPGVHLEDQIWQPCKPNVAAGRQAAAFWLGRPKGDFVSPATLSRPRQLPSTAVRLADGNDWLVPIAVKLPHKITLDADGEPIRKVASRYEQFYQRAEKYFALLRGHRRGEERELAGAYHFAVEALAFNYRFNRDVADFLDLFTEENLLWTMGATFEVRELDAWQAQKKKLA
jgi:hypothetical protein